MYLLTDYQLNENIIDNERIESSIALRMAVLWRDSSLFALYILVAGVSS